MYERRETNMETRKPLGQLLKEAGYLTEDYIQFALKEQKASGERLGEVLVRLGIVTDFEIAKVLAAQAGYPFLDLRNIIPETKALIRVPAPFARKKGVLPFKIENGVLWVAISDPFDQSAIDALLRFAETKVKIFVAPQNEIKRVSEWYYYFLDNPPEKKLEDTLARLKLNPNYEFGAEELLEQILVLAITKRATDIHLVPSDLTSRIYFRLDGMLELIFVFPRVVHSRLVGTVKVRSNMDIAEQRLPQDGRFSFKFLGEEYDLRVSTVRASQGENVVIRLLPVHSTVLHLSSLGFSDDEIKLLRFLFTRPHGMILVTGPTGSGKTTTLYSSLRMLDVLQKNVVTAEDPIEYYFPLIRQTQVNEEIGYTFSSAIRHFLRQDPDIIMVGEIRDVDTANMAVRAALTGHLFLSTLHTNDAISVVARLRDLGLNSSLLSTVLLGATAQRLVRKICPSCKERYEPPKDLLEYYKMPNDIPYYRGKGCHNCRNTGYLGRTAITEIFLVNDSIRNLIANDASVADIYQEALNSGYRPLLESAKKRVLDGITTVEEIQRVVG